MHPPLSRYRAPGATRGGRAYLSDVSIVASSRRVDVIPRIACRRASLRPADRIPPAPCPTGRRGYPQPRRGNCRRRGWTLWRGHPPPPSEGARSPPSSRANDNLRADTPRDFNPIDFPTDLPTRPTIPSRYPSIPHPLSSHASPRRTRLSSRTRPRPRGGHRLLPLPAQTLARPRSRLVGEIQNASARGSRRGAPRCPVDPHSAAPRRPARIRAALKRGSVYAPPRVPSLPEPSRRSWPARDGWFDARARVCEDLDVVRRRVAEEYVHERASHSRRYGAGWYDDEPRYRVRFRG